MKTLLLFILALFIAAGGYSLHDERTSPAEEKKEKVSKSTGQPELIPSTPTQTLNRSYQGLTKLPSTILSMTELRQLNLSHNRLTGALPAEIRHLRNLETLDISYNDMTGLPAELGQLSELRTLNASNNRLTGIPHELGNLQNLEVLDLSGNDISQQDLEVIRTKLPHTTEIIL